MKKSILFTLGLSVILMTSVSCKKACDIPEEDTYSGSIIHEVDGKAVVIYPSSGGLLDSYPNGLNINSSSAAIEQDRFEVSFDGGITRQNVDFSQYTILGYKLTTACDAAIDRSVVVDDINGFVTFTTTVTECKEGCNELRNIENYVLVPAFDPSYPVVYNIVQ
jgi:hypothetical protein